MIKKYKPMIYIFYGSSGIGKTLFANAVSNGLKDFKVVEDTTNYDIRKEFEKGKCVIIDNVKSKLNAEILARILTDDGFKTVLVEFKRFV